MEINTLIIYIMVVFMIIGAVDRMIGNKFGYGKKFEEGIMAMGPLALSMIGIISLSPVIAKGLKPIITPFYEMIGSIYDFWGCLHNDLQQIWLWLKV